MVDRVEDAADANKRDSDKTKLAEITAAYKSYMLPLDTPADMLDLLTKLK